MASGVDEQVLIVGGGPVGLTLAMDLASRGIGATVVEMRERGEPPSVKCNHVSARSMEIFRRLGIVEKVRNAGLPADYANDISYRTTTTGTELTRILIPSRERRYAAKGGPDTWWPTPEPPHRINQIFLEPVLFASAEAMAGVRIINRAEVTDLVQDAEGVTATIRHADGRSEMIRSRYAVGCDGGRSPTRKLIGSRLVGDAVVQRVQSTYLRAPGLIDLMQVEPAWATFSLNPRRSGNVYAIDGRETWLVHNYLRDSEPDFDSVDRDRSIRDILGVGDDFQYEVFSNEDWFGRRLVADKFRQDRIFICGDAAHLWVPYAGYGMNAGLADAANLAWLLAAVLKGWAGEAILDAHEAERLPITEQVSHFAMNHAHAMASQRKAVPERIEEESAEGVALRLALGRAAYDLNVQQYAAAGLNFGYYYDKSPLIAYDGEMPPPYSMGTFTESTVPGCRVPHVWLKDGRSLYDAMGPDHALIRSDQSVDVSPFVTAANRAGVPLRVVDIDPVPIYQQKLVLSRPDQHVAWRGDALPQDSEALVARISGRAA
ncbi:MAG TPA: FAD-dependent oxidoreductase [Devosiaceae bacterium]|jgi:2-polyprenyl-6-methoxyphenol hydroxylase-like FAD-dependent oxidoreductase